MATKHHQQQQHRSQQHEEQGPVHEPATAPASDVDPHDISTVRNQHEDLPPPEPPVPLKGDVKDGASDPAEKDTVSVLANKPDHSPIPPAHPLTGEVADDANEPGEVPPSVQGTSQAPKKE